MSRERIRLWITTHRHDSTTGMHYWLYLLDWKLARLDSVIDDAGEFDFWPTRRLYIACSPRNDVWYDKRRTVWTAKAWAGDWSTGKTWEIVSGLVWVKSVSLQP